MNIQLTTDMALVKAIITEPEIWERASEDGIDPESFLPGYDSMTTWLLCLEGGNVAGIILVHMENSISLNIHPYLRVQYRQKGKEMMEAFYRWFLEETQDKIMKINVHIPEVYKKVINFAKRVGFKKEGFNRDSYLKNGHIYGQQHLGITRSEIGDWLNERGF